jgi:hypothetical protein
MYRSQDTSLLTSITVFVVVASILIGVVLAGWWLAAYLWNFLAGIYGWPEINMWIAGAILTLVGMLTGSTRYVYKKS